MSEDEFTLSLNERLVLANQFRILERVDPERASEHDRKAQILERGFEGQYGAVLGRFAENRLSVEQSRTVEEVLLLCSWLQDHRGAGTLDVSEFAQVGFDGNAEFEHMSYARFLFDSNRGGYPGVDGIVDVHRPTLDRYRRMITAWKQSRDRPRLSEADVARILAASMAPDI